MTRRSWLRLDRPEDRARWLGVLVLLCVTSLSAMLYWLRVDRDRETARANAAERALVGASGALTRADDALMATLRVQARDALHRDDPLTARANVRAALERGDDVAARALWWQLRGDPLQWRLAVGAYVHGVAFSPDNGFVAAAGAAGTVWLLDAQSGWVRRLRGDDAQITALVFSPDGTRLAAAGSSGRVALWDPDEIDPPATLAGESRVAVGAMRFSPDGATLALGRADGSVELWDVARAHRLRTMAVDETGVGGVAWTDGGSLVSGTRDGHVHVLSAEDGAITRHLEAGAASVNDVDVSADGKYLAAAGGDGLVRILDVAAGTVLRSLGLPSGAARRVRFSESGKLLAATGGDDTVMIWEADTGRVFRVLEGHGGGVASLSWSRGGWLAVGGGLVSMWDLHADPPPDDVAEGHEGAVHGVAFGAKGAVLASGGADGTVRLWDAATGAAGRVMSGHAGGVWSVGFRADGEQVASGGADASVRLWDPTTGRAVKVLEGHEASVADVAYSASGRLVASASADHTVRVWSASSGEPQTLLSGHTLPVSAVVFTPDGGGVVSGGADAVLRVWDVLSARQVREIAGHTQWVWGLDLDPRGQRLVSASADGVVRVSGRDGKGGRVLAELSSRAFGVDVHPAGAHVAVAGADGTVVILALDAAEGAPPYKVLSGHDGAVNRVAFSADGRAIASAGDDGSVRLFDAATGRPSWRGTALLGSPPALLSHLGWRASGEDQVAVPDAVQEALTREASLARGDGAQLCVVTGDGRVQRWSADTMSAETKLDDVVDVAPFGGGCAARTRQGALVVLGLDGGTRPLLEERVVTAIAGAEAELLAAAGSSIVRLAPGGEVIGSHAIGAGATAVALAHGRVAVGYGDGSLRLADEGPRTGPPFRPLPRELPRAAVTRLAPGPPGTLAAGFANGVVALFDVRDGGRLRHGRVHGRVRFLRRDGDALHAATDLGRWLVWDLAVFAEDRCALLRSVWASVQVVSQHGHVITLAPPSEHPCQALGPAEP